MIDLSYKGMLSLLLVVLLSCSKEDRKTSVEGRVITFGTESKATNEPLRMGLYRTIVGTGLGTGEELVEETVTDTNGFYQFSFKPEGNASYYLRLITQPIAKHFSISYSNQVQIERGIKQKKDYALRPYAWVRLRIINNGPHYPGDKIRFSLGGGENYEFYGPVNREDIYLISGNVSYNLFYAVTRNSSVTGHEANIPFIPAFDTISHLIEY